VERKTWDGDGCLWRKTAGGVARKGERRGDTPEYEYRSYRLMTKRNSQGKAQRGGGSCKNSGLAELLYVWVDMAWFHSIGKRGNAMTSAVC